MSTINEDHMIYGSWDIRQSRQSFCHFGLFLALWSSNNLKIKWKKTPGGIIILHICTTYDDNHMMYGFWDMECQQNFFAFILQIKMFTKMKKMLADIILHMRTKNYDQMMYGSWEVLCNKQTNRCTHGKSNIERWVTHLKNGLTTQKMK